MASHSTKDILLDRVVTVIANEGLDKTTTKAIVAGTGINEAYIYRNFEDKEDMISKAFDMLDSELVSQVMLNIRIMNGHDGDFEARSRIFFSGMWRFLLGNREKCLAFIRYYYSPYFKKYSAEAHKERCEPIIKEFKKIFREESNVWMLLVHILNVMLDFAIKVYDGAVPDDDDTQEHVFRLIYHSVKQYFKN